MRLKPIIRSLLEDDLYKYSMGQAIYHKFPGHMTTWTFKCRNPEVIFTPEMVDEIREQVQAYCDLEYKKEELAFLSTILWIHQDYIEFLRNWKPRFEDFTIDTNSTCGLRIEATGSWLNVSRYEMPVLMIVNEVWFRMTYNYDDLYGSFCERLYDKYNALKSGHWYVNTFSGFGLRRRLSGEAEEKFVDVFSHLNDTMHCASTFVGISNVYLAWKYDLMPTGTMAHEWIMGAGQGDIKHNPAYCNWYALKAWTDEYGILNGTALTDTIGTDTFLKDFQLTFATLFSGVRHDSGDPITWGEKLIAHYESLGIDPKTKTLLFSDSLNFEAADKICRHFQGRAKTAFGIGTYLTNDTFAKPLNIVMKMTECNGHDVAKLSDVDGKGMCKNAEYERWVRDCIYMREDYAL